MMVISTVILFAPNPVFLSLIKISLIDDTLCLAFASGDSLRSYKFDDTVNTQHGLEVVDKLFFALCDVLEGV